ncbi:hypothetical protein MRX96_025651 [Rhipicephalus microplus]
MRGLEAIRAAMRLPSIGGYRSAHGKAIVLLTTFPFLNLSAIPAHRSAINQPIRTDCASRGKKGRGKPEGTACCGFTLRHCEGRVSSRRFK